MINRISLSVVFLLAFGLSGLAQDAAQTKDADKVKAEHRAKLIDMLLADIPQLRLPENRAFILAKVGAARWKDDQERASTNFRDAVANLIAAQAAAEANKNPNQRSYDLLNSQSLRPTVLNSIANVDAEYALESLYKSRPVAVQRALASLTSTTKINNSSGSFPQIAQQEINLEQRLLKMAAEQKPEKGLAALKESIKKNLSNETLDMLKKVFEKEPDAGNDLANDVVSRLLSKPFFSGASNNILNFELINLSNTMLSEFVRERPAEERRIAFDESRMRALANKVIGTYIERGQEMGYVPVQVLEPIAKRFAPTSIEQLKRASNNNRGFGHRGLQQDDAYQKLLSTNPSAETLLSEAKKFPVDTRRSLYITAANKLSDAGQYDRALALLNDNFEDDALDNAIGSLNWYYAHLLINRGDFDGAESMMMQFGDSNRISALTSLAMTIYNRNPEENRSRANGILQRVRSFLPEKPENANEMNQLFQLINSMAAIEPNDAFRNFEPLIDQINDISEAWVVVNGFQGGYTRQGECQLSMGMNYGVNLDAYLVRTLAQKDFARTMTMIDGLSRREMRVLLISSLLEGGDL